MDFQSLTTFNKDALEVINDTPLFNIEEKQELKEATVNMDKAFFNSQIFRTDTEVRISVLNDVKFPTPASKYYQALRELNVHQCELVNLLYEYETQKQDLRIIQADIEDFKVDSEKAEGTTKSRLDAEMCKKQIEWNKIQFSLKSMKRTAQGRKQEIMQWNTILHELEPTLIELKIPVDDPNVHQKMSYAIRFIRQTRNSLIQNVTMGTAEANNLLGQLTSILKVIEKDKLHEILFENLDEDEKLWIIDQKLITV